jgi:hypothetical protein
MFGTKSSICNKLFVPKEMDYYFKEMDCYFAIFAINSKNIDTPTPALKSLGLQLCYDYLLQRI